MDFLKPKIVINKNKYAVLDQIGEGAYAFVYKVKSLAKQKNAVSNEKLYAIKKIICQTEEQLVEAKKEIKFFQSVRHENVAGLLGSEIIQKKSLHEVYLLLPLYPHGNVQSLIDKGTKGYPNSIFGVESVVMRNILIDCCNGLKAIHAAGFRHADFKPANILLNRANRAVIVDFGSVSPIRIEVTTRSQALTIQEDAAVHTTASYRAPELFDTPSHCIIDGKADIWSFGCALYTMMYSRSPFESAKEGLSILAVRSGHYSIPTPNKWPTPYVDIIVHCLQVECENRITIDDLHTKLTALLNIKANSNEFHASFPNTENVSNDLGSQNKLNNHVSEHVDEFNFADFDERNEKEENHHEEDNDDDNVEGDQTHEQPHEDSITKNKNVEEAEEVDDEFGDFESAPTPIVSVVESAPMKSIPIVEQAKILSIKTMFGTMLRPKGLTRQLAMKPVCILIIPSEEIIVRKSVDPDSKVHCLISLSHPVKLTPSTGSDHVVSVHGVSNDTSQSRSIISSTLSNINNNNNNTTTNNNNNNNSYSKQTTSQRQVECTIDLGFSTADLLHDFIHAVNAATEKQ